MFRRRWFGPLARRPLVRGAVVGGLGYLLGRRATGRNAANEPAGTAETADQASVSARLTELDELRDAGQVTPEEYASKRAEILRDV